MRVAFVFFLCLCVHLRGGYTAHAGVYHCITSCSLAQHIAKTQQAESASASHNYIITANSDIEEDKDDLFSMEDDDDEEEAVTRKYILLDKYFSTFFYAFLSSHHCNYLPETFCFCKQVFYTGPPKYIAQRVLKI